jgi:hypothetical protein
MRASMRVAETTVMSVLWLEPQSLPRLTHPPGLMVRRLTTQEISYAECDPTFDLEPAFTEDALAKGDVCIGVFFDDELASYGWYASTPTKLTPDITVSCRFADTRYMYKGFTHPKHRGRGLYTRGLLRAAPLLPNADDVRFIFSFVNRRNLASLAAARSAGYVESGVLATCHRFGQLVFLSAKARIRGVQLDLR